VDKKVGEFPIGKSMEENCPNQSITPEFPGKDWDRTQNRCQGRDSNLAIPNTNPERHRYINFSGTVFITEEA